MPESKSLEKPLQKAQAPADVPEKLRPGKLFAWFELLRELAKGNRGAVWLAHDYSVGRQVDHVALRFLPDFIISDKTVVEELKNRIRRIAALKHPNILGVYDLVESKGGVAIQTEYLDGQSLSSLRLTRPNQVFEARDLEKWVKELCDVLKYAHEDVGLIHGDIVPGNLIVDVSGNLKLKDFGIETCMTGATTRSMAIHDAGESQAYQSPQRAAGEEPAITDDLYSLGATIYELLTSKPPFYAGDIGVQVTGKIPPSMTERRAELGIQGTVIPKHWEETVAACLAKDPLCRPQSAIEVKDRLKLAPTPTDLSAKPVSEPAPQPIENPKSPVQIPLTRKSWLVVVGIILLFAFGSTISFYLYHLLIEPKSVNIVSNTMAARTNASPDRASLPTPAVPPSRTGFIGQESLRPAQTPSVAASPTASAPVSPIPSAEASPTPSAEAKPTPSAEASPTPSAEASPTPSRQETAASNEMQSARPSPTPLSTNDAAAIKEDVILRINAIPGISDEKKANLIQQMHRARSMERLAVIPFDNGKSSLRRAATDELVKMFDTPEMREKVSDPTIVLVVAGYADSGGPADVNLRISQTRAENVSRILKEQAKLLNAMQTIGMGGTELLDTKQPGQNRAVEVWAVVPL